MKYKEPQVGFEVSGHQEMQDVCHYPTSKQEQMYAAVSRHYSWSWGSSKAIRRHGFHIPWWGLRDVMQFEGQKCPQGTHKHLNMLLMSI